MIKYLICPDYVTSANDHEAHYITFDQLVQLYGVNPDECIDMSKAYQIVGINLDELIHLKPRYHGDYEL